MHCCRTICAATFLAAAVIRASGQKDDGPIHFRKLAERLSGQTVQREPNLQAIEAIELVLKHLVKDIGHQEQPSRSQVEKSLKPFEAELQSLQHSAEGAGSTQYIWLDAHVDRRSGLLAIAVTFGGASRLAIFETTSGKRVAVPKPCEWITPNQSEPFFLPDGSIILVDHLVHELGIRTAFRVNLLRRVSGRYTLSSSWTRDCSLEFGGVGVNGSKVKWTSLDSPKSFYPAASEPLFKREESWRYTGAGLKKTRETKGNPELRYIDRWMEQARQSASKDRYQKTFARMSPEPESLLGYRVNRSADGKTSVVTMQLESGEVRFTLTKAGSEYRFNSLELRSRQQ